MSKTLVGASAPVELPASAPVGETAVGGQEEKIAAILAARKPQHIKTASLADVLGFNPRKTAPPVSSADPLDGLSRGDIKRYCAMKEFEALALDAAHYEIWIAAIKLLRRDQLEDWQWELRDAHSRSHRHQVEHRVHTANQFGLSGCGDHETRVADDPPPIVTRQLFGMSPMGLA